MRLSTRGKSPKPVATATGSPGYRSDEGSGAAGLWGNTDRAQGSTCPVHTWESTAALSSQPEATHHPGWLFLIPACAGPHQGHTNSSHTPNQALWRSR